MEEVARTVALGAASTEATPETVAVAGWTLVALPVTVETPAGAETARTFATALQTIEAIPAAVDVPKYTL
jgi:hypothetical protein